jgi:hypothetical protein
MQPAKSFLLGFSIILFSGAAFAQENIDYDKPYDQIQEQIRRRNDAPQNGFESRHSLMPRDFGNEDSAVPVVSASTGDAAAAGSSTTEAVSAPEAKAAEPITLEPVQGAPVAPAKSTTTEPARGELAETPAPAAASVPSVAAGAEGADPEPVLLREVRMERLEMPTEYMESGGMLIPAPIVPVIDERAGDMTNVPLFSKDGATGSGQRAAEPGPVRTLDIAPPTPQENPRSRDMLTAPAPSGARPAPASMFASAHVASYNTETSALKGVEVLGGKYPRTGALAYRIALEDVPGKGYFYRLYFEGDKKEVGALCREIKASGEWCRIDSRL